MESVKQQIVKLVDKKKNILVIAPENINGDAISATLALSNVLKKIANDVQFILPKELPKRFEFFPIINSSSRDILRKKEFVLTIKNIEHHIDNLRYQKKDDFLHLYFNAEKEVEKKDFWVNPSYYFDLIFTINTQDFENLGDSFRCNPDLFFKTPVINIDNDIANENFGEVNLVDTASSSVSEIVMELIDFLDRNLLDEKIATLVLAGLIDATHNFQSSKTTPQTFNNAALLVSRGADRQKIIRYFYKTKSINFLRLWGQILRRLSWNKKEKLVYGTIEQKDFQKTNTDSNSILQILEEMKIVFPEMKIAFLIWFTGKEIKGIVHSLNLRFLEKLVSDLSGLIKNNNLFFSINKQYFGSQLESKALNEVKQKILDLINKAL